MMCSGPGSGIHGSRVDNGPGGVRPYTHFTVSLFQFPENPENVSFFADSARGIFLCHVPGRHIVSNIE